MNRIISRQAAAELVNDHDTVVVCGCENLLLPDRILSALEERAGRKLLALYGEDV